jgi:quercetin dioxygenase-like cupin family protein
MYLLNNDPIESVSNQPGSGMRPGLDTVFVAGDGNEKELYSLVFKAPANTAIQPHSHPDDRSCFVLSGLWYFGYGTVRDEAKLEALPPGSNYTEPAGTVHFAGTKGQEAIVECTGVGPGISIDFGLEVIGRKSSCGTRLRLKFVALTTKPRIQIASS